MLFFYIGNSIRFINIILHLIPEYQQTKLFFLLATIYRVHINNLVPGHLKQNFQVLGGPFQDTIHVTQVRNLLLLM